MKGINETLNIRRVDRESVFLSLLVQTFQTTSLPISHEGRFQTMNVF